MIRKWILFINLFLVGITSFLLIAILSVAFVRPHEIPIIESQAVQKPLPKSSFVLTKDTYDEIGRSLLSLKYIPPTMQLPNLKNLLIYFGPNGRPDASKDATSLHLAIVDARNQASIAPKEHLYLLYDRQQTPPRYIFSPNNSPTSLWVQAEPKGNDVMIKVMMKNENGEIIQEPSAHSDFLLQPKEYGRFASGGGNWELGKWRVDGTILSRQHARWYGQDRFLEKHGGDEFEPLSSKQRIDFGEGDDVYSVYVGVDDALIWDTDSNRWKVVKPGKDTLGHPLMQLKKADERLLTFLLWDTDGKNRINLNLLKSNEQWIPKNLQQDFKFVAARTRSQYVFEINKERMLLKPKDWLVLTETGWKKLETEQDIDNFVERKITGPLFVFNGVIKKDDHQVLVGTMFNASRTDMQMMEIDLTQGNMTILTMPSDKANQQPQKNPSPTRQAAVPDSPHIPAEKIPESTVPLPPHYMGNSTSIN